MKHLIALLLSLAMALICVSAIDAADISWDGAASPLNLSHTHDILQLALTLDAHGRPITIWASAVPTGTKGIFIARPGETPIPVITTTVENLWTPALAAHGVYTYAVWVQGAPGSSSTIYQQDVGAASPPKTVMSSVYGEASPQLVVGTDRLHLFFVSAANEAMSTQADLYYTQRRFDAESWIAPTLIITHAQANLPKTDGGVWRPQVALSANNSTAHLVWEQTGGSRDRRSVWYARGVWNTTRQAFDWGQFTRLSLPTQIGVQPKIAVDGADRVHITWVEQVLVQDPHDSNKSYFLQYINYQRLENGQWSPPLSEPALRLDPDPVQVNTYRPTWSTIGMDARGNAVCVAWDGYRGDPGASGTEEILMRCSKDGGKKWDDQTTNTSQTTALSFFPSLRLGVNGDVHLAWKEHQGGFYYDTNYDVFYRQGPIPREKVYLPLTLRG